jgi:hypothetical protein
VALSECARRAGAQPAVTGAQVIGIDEWAKRKGRTYGTIVVDLERHTVISSPSAFDQLSLIQLLA